MKVKICGIPHEVKFVKKEFETGDINLGEIVYADALIRINVSLTKELKKETLCHEILHGMLTHIGYEELSNDERFVTALGNAISQTFEVIEEGEEK